MKKNEEVVTQLVEASRGGLAVVVVGDYGSGKNWLCQMAAQKLGLDPHTIQLEMLEPSEYATLSYPDKACVIFDGLQRVDYENMPAVAEAVNKCAGGHRTVFLTIPPASEAHNAMGRIKEFLIPATGTDRRIVEVPK